MLSGSLLPFFLSASFVPLSLISASPVLQYGRAVTELNQEAFREAHSRDESASRTSSNTEIRTSDGQCLFIDQLSGDFRANLVPIQVAACDGSQGQSWDILSSGIHNNAPGKVLVVSTLTQACLDINKGRVGNEVTTFSCGGRADGDGKVSRDQLFTVNSASFSLTTDAADGTCLSVQGTKIVAATCQVGASSQTFTLGAGAGVGSGGNAPVTSARVEQPLVTSTTIPVVETTLLTSTRAAPAPTTTPQNNAPVQGNPTTPVPVSRAGGTLNPSLAVEAHTRDNSATRARTAVSLKSSDGNCLSIDPTAGDFRQNLIPVKVEACNGSSNQKFDIITSGVHNNEQGKALVVSSLMNGCVNFDTRRAAGDKVMVFSCGGRAAGEGKTTPDQLFEFTGGNSIKLIQTKNENGQQVTTCLTPQNGELEDSQNCGGDVATYTFV